MGRHPKPPPPRPPPDSDPGVGFDPVEEWLVDFDQAMEGELGAKSLGPTEEAVVPRAPRPTTTCGDAGKVSDGSAAPKSCEFGVKEEGSLGQAGDFCGEEIDEKAEMASGGLCELLAPDQLLASGIGDLAVKEDISEGAVATEVGAAPTDVEMNIAASVKEEGGGDKEKQDSSEEESESSEEDESSEASSSSEEEEEQRPKKDEESSEASSSSDEEEELGAKKLCGAGGAEGDSLEALLEEGELMVGSDEEGEEPKGPIKSKHQAEVLTPVPKIEIQLEPHHQTLPVGSITAIMGERVIVEGSVQHNPLNEGSILWITESRMPLGIIDELFGPVKNPYYLVRYNSEEEVPAGISVGNSVSFVAEFADHILNMKELYAKGYDASGDNDEVLEDELEFSDDEKEAEYKRSLRQAKRQTDRQHEPNKPSGDKRRSQPRGAGFRKDMPPRNRDAQTPGHQSQPRFHRSDMSPAVAKNAARPLGPQNIPVSAPTMPPPVQMNPAMPSPVYHANQMGGCFVNPAQQFLPQQPNMVWPGGLPPPPHLNMGVEGAALAANIMQNLFAGTNQFQNQNFGGFPNQMLMPFPQFMPQTVMPANPLTFGGGPPVNSPFGPPPLLPMGQGNFGQPPHMAGDRQEQGHPPPGFPPNSQGFGNLAQPHGDGEHSPMQLNSGQFNRGSSSFRGRKPQQRGGRHSSGRGIRHSR
ncbi:H/ACA ribonucleoprotein complex non-core subunit NAF1-like [Phragmites australis]|uniref:H/ACA ribonucleoprotein complex non-core subunit NAF1-like n=1 Tax=Phragmites australis TaxID=29695 RepID=UPI002D769F6F|nr:H/ACA ribonucleoprotein complex non-core subunit NAF1-like [Phragmites australis]